MSEPTRPMISADKRREVAENLRSMAIGHYIQYKE